MPVGTNWNNSGEASTVDVQIGGEGNRWRTFDQNAKLDAPSGGGRASQTLWGRGELGGLEPRSIISTGNPDDFTYNLSLPYIQENALRKFNCPLTIRARQYCGKDRVNMMAYVQPGMVIYQQSRVTSKGYDNGLAMNDGAGTDVMKTLAMTASFEQPFTSVAHDDISLTTSDVAYKRVIGISADTCAGACGLGTSEEDAWLAVTLKDSSPAYAGGSAPWLYWTVDAWATRGATRIGTLVGADALDVVMAGSRVLVFSDTKAPVYAQLANIYAGVADPLLWASATGFTGITGTNFPKAAVAVDSSTILAVGNGGRIWLSTDGGITYTLIYDTGVITSQNLNAIHAAPSGNAFVGGNAGTFIRLGKTPGVSAFTASLIVVKDALLNILSSNINSVRTPPQRGNEVYLGTAGGEIWRCRTINSTLVPFENMGFDRTGIGSITDMNFAGFRGNTLFVVQTNTDGTSQILRDFSGGNLGNDVEAIGNFTTPGNFGINSFAAANPNFGISVGNNHGSYAFLGKVRSS